MAGSKIRGVFCEFCTVKWRRRRREANGDNVLGPLDLSEVNLYQSNGL